MMFTDSYLDETLALLVRDHDRERFVSWREIGQQSLTLGVPDVPYFIAKLHELLPRVTLREFTDIESTLTGSADLDAIALPAERGSAWTLLHPEYSVIVPDGALVKIPLAFAVGRSDAGFARFLNTWIELKRKDGTLDSLYKYWVLGENASPKPPRWSIIRDVLHWVE